MTREYIIIPLTIIVHECRIRIKHGRGDGYKQVEGELEHLLHGLALPERLLLHNDLPSSGLGTRCFQSD